MKGTTEVHIGDGVFFEFDQVKFEKFQRAYEMAVEKDKGSFPFPDAPFEFQTNFAKYVIELLTSKFNPQ